MDSAKLTPPAARILLWTDSYWPRIGGGESWTRRCLRELKVRGHEAAIVEVSRHPIESGLQEVDGVPILRLAARTAFEGKDAKALISLKNQALAFAESFAADVVLVSAFGAEALVLLNISRGALGRPVIAAIHAEWPSAHLQAGGLVDRLIQRSAAVVVFDPEIGGWVKRLDPGIASRLRVIPLAVGPSGPPAALSGQTILFLGRLSAEKGADVAIAAFAAMAQRAPGARLAIAGEGPETSNLTRQAARVGLSDRIDFLGRIDPEAVNGQIDAAAVVVMPSRIEAVGLVALEAAWRGRPVVASAVGGLARTIVDGETGILCAPDDSDAFGAALLRLVCDPELAGRLGAAARTRAEAGFTWVDHVNQVEALIGNLAETSG